MLFVSVSLVIEISEHVGFFMYLGQAFQKKMILPLSVFHCQCCVQRKSKKGENVIRNLHRKSHNESSCSSWMGLTAEYFVQLLPFKAEFTL